MSTMSETDLLLNEYAHHHHRGTGQVRQAEIIAELRHMGWGIAEYRPMIREAIEATAPLTRAEKVREGLAWGRDAIAMLAITATLVAIIWIVA
jgi:hypothetical protein